MRTNLSPSLCCWLAAGLLCLLFAQLVTSAVIKSPTFDEPAHGSYGYTDLLTGDWRLQRQNPPFVHLLTGVTLFLLPERPDPRQLEHWKDFDLFKVSREILEAFNRPWDVLLFPQRVMVISLTLLLGASLFRWAAERHGATGGLLALFVYTFSPNILAHGRLVTADLAFTFCFLLSVYTFQTLLDHPSIKQLLIAGIALGLALGAKLSALLLIPILALLTLLHQAFHSPLQGDDSPRPQPLSPPLQVDDSPHPQPLPPLQVDDSPRPQPLPPLQVDDSPRSQPLPPLQVDDSPRSQPLPPLQLGPKVGYFILTGLIASLVLWGLYGFETGPWSKGWPALPLPSYIQAVTRLRNHGARGHQAYLMGTRARGGWPQYFLVALLLKTPLPTLIGALWGTLWLLWQRRWWSVLVASFPSAMLFLVAIRFPLNIGYRHILPVIPFLVLIIAALADIPWQKRPALAIVGIGLAAWLVLGTLKLYPDYLAYFNELAGGPTGGRRYLTDSNLDWGQDLIQLHTYTREQNIEALYLSYFGNIDPADYGLNYIPLPSFLPLGASAAFTPFAPGPGTYAVSVTNLSGQYLDNPDILSWFQHQSPTASIGHSLNLYHLPADAPQITWVAQCSTPTAPLDDAAIRYGFGHTDLRRLDFDCTQAWLYPTGGTNTGTYALHHDLLTQKAECFPPWLPCPPRPNSPFMIRHLKPTRLAYEQPQTSSWPAFALYEWSNGTPPYPQARPLYAAPAEAPPAALAQATSLDIPVRLNGPLTFLGINVYHSEDGLDVETWWDVNTSKPITRPLSVMGHLITSTGEALDVADGFAVWPLALTKGDVVVQQHNFTLPDSNQVVWLRTGAYWLDTMERWTTHEISEADVLLIPLDVVDLKE